MDDSILISVKKMLGIDRCCDSFDAELIMNINSVFSTFRQLGVDPLKYGIESSNETWADIFDVSPTLLSYIKTCTYMKVRLIFDPPTTSFVLDSLNAQIKEQEWRIHIEAEGGFDGRESADSLRRPRNALGHS